LKPQVKEAEKEVLICPNTKKEKNVSVTLKEQKDHVFFLSGDLAINVFILRLSQFVKS
jgi:hypothetical protein